MAKLSFQFKLSEFIIAIKTEQNSMAPFYQCGWQQLPLFLFSYPFYIAFSCATRKRKRPSDTIEQASASPLGYQLDAQKAKEQEVTDATPGAWSSCERKEVARLGDGRRGGGEVRGGWTDMQEGWRVSRASAVLLNQWHFRYLEFFQNKDAHWRLFHIRSSEAKTNYCECSADVEKNLLMASYWLDIK